MAQIIADLSHGATPDVNPAKAQGVLTQALNIAYDMNGSVRSRRGFEMYALPATVSTVYRLFPFQAGLIMHYTGSGGEKLAYSTGTAAVTDIASYPAMSGYATRAAVANKSLYLTSTTGIKKLDVYNASYLLSAGVPRPLDMTAAAIAAWTINTAYTVGTVVTNDTAPIKYYRCTVAGTSAGATGPTGTGAAIVDNTVTWAYVSTASSALAVVSDNKYAYRTVVGYKDANMVVSLSAPSQRTIVTAASGAATANVNLRMYLPTGLTSSSPTYFYQLYRSVGSGTDATEPSDEMGLVYEANLTSTDVSAGYVNCIDVCPDSMMGPTGYFCASQEGILQANNQPPLATEVALFGGNLLFGNLTYRHRLFLSLLSTDVGTGIRVNDTLTIGGQVYTGKSAENTASRQFKVFTSGTPGQNMEDTAKSLIRCVNADASNTTYAYYVTGYQETGSKILFEGRTLGASAFTAVASANGNAYSPPLTSTVTSTNDNFKNGLAWSKIEQPDACPTLNYLRLGDSEKYVRKIVPMRGYALVFKDDGVWRISGAAPYSVDQISATASIMFPDSAQAVGANEALYFDRSGRLKRVSEYGVKDASENFGLYSWGVTSTATIDSSLMRVGIYNKAIDSYMIPGRDGLVVLDAKGRQSAWAINHITNFGPGACMKDDVLYLTAGDFSQYLLKQEPVGVSSYSQLYFDGRDVITISSIDSATNRITLSAPLTIAANIGDVVESGAVYKVVTNPVSTTVLELDSTDNMNTGLTALRRCYDTSLTYVFTGGNVLQAKNWEEIALAMSNWFYKTVNVYVSSDLTFTASGGGESAAIPLTGGWLSGETQGASLGAAERFLIPPERTLVPRFQGFSNKLVVRLSNKVAMTVLVLDSLAVTYDSAAETPGVR